MSHPPIDLTSLSLQPVQACELAQLQTLSIRTFTDAFAEANTQKDMEMYVAEAFSEEQLKAEMQASQATFYLLKSGEDDTLGYCKLKHGLPAAVKQNGYALEICRLYVSQDY
jgi:diamine N-acetyltransferase